MIDLHPAEFALAAVLALAVVVALAMWLRR
jgi:hypothetical protein